MTVRSARGRGKVRVWVDGALLGWRASLAVRNHSPPGPAWGYDGPGPVRLALVIVQAVTDQAAAERYYQGFKWGGLHTLLQAVCYSFELGMVTETRCISPIEDLIAVELVCTDSSLWIRVHPSCRAHRQPAGAGLPAVQDALVERSAPRGRETRRRWRTADLAGRSAA